MALKIEYHLNPKWVTNVVKHINTSSNGLVKRVLAEETKYIKECKKLIKCNKEEFYPKRDELIEALNLYQRIGSCFNINEEEKNKLEYKTFHKEIKELKKKRKLRYAGTVPTSTGCGVLAIASMFISPPLYFIFTACQLGTGILSMYSNNGKKFGSKGYLKHHTALKTYIDVIKKSKKADEFMHEVPLLNVYHPDYKDSEIIALYQNNPPSFIDHFSNIKDTEDKKRIIKLIYGSDQDNEEVIQWLDKNEPKLIEDIGLNII